MMANLLLLGGDGALPSPGRTAEMEKSGRMEKTASRLGDGKTSDRAWWIYYAAKGKRTIRRKLILR
jgi:hypothetical protein